MTHMYLRRKYTNIIEISSLRIKAFTLKMPFGENECNGPVAYSLCSFKTWR